MRYESVDTYIGHYDYKRFARRTISGSREKSVLDNEALRARQNQLHPVTNQLAITSEGAVDIIDMHNTSSREIIDF